MQRSRGLGLRRQGRIRALNCEIFRIRTSRKIEFRERMFMWGRLVRKFCATSRQIYNRRAGHPQCVRCSRAGEAWLKAKREIWILDLLLSSRKGLSEHMQSESMILDAISSLIGWFYLKQNNSSILSPLVHAEPEYRSKANERRCLHHPSISSFSYGARCVDLGEGNWPRGSRIKIPPPW